MTKFDSSFRAWFDLVSLTVFDDTGVEFHDRSRVRGSYDLGRDAFDVADELIEAIDPL